MSSVDKVNYYLFELTRAALRDVGKYVVKKFKTKYYSIFKRYSGDGGRSTRYKVYSNKDTMYPRVEIGLPHSHKGKTVTGFYAYFQEFGTSKQKKLGLLLKTVEEDISEIRKIESQYLSAIEDEEKIKSIIDESEYEGNADE